MSISSPPNFGSPDWQRGYYSAQKALASVPAGTFTATVTVPPNAETLIVQGVSFPAGAYVTMQGDTTGIVYAGFKTDRVNFVSGLLCAFFDVASVLDDKVTIQIFNSGNHPWYVYADAGTHVVGDINKAVDLNNYQYVVPCAPSGYSSDHPVNELKVASGVATTSGGVTILPAPGDGLRYRVFSAQLIVATGTLNANLVDGISNTAFINAANNSPGFMSFAPSGLPLGSNAGVLLNIANPNGSTYGVVSYTEETV